MNTPFMKDICFTAVAEEGTVGTVEDSQGFGLPSVSGNAGSSWDTKLPPSLLAETSPVKRSPLSSPSKSPNKSSPEKSPSEVRMVKIQYTYIRVCQNISRDRLYKK